MHILLAAKHPPIGGIAFGGVASWIQTVQKQLEKRGHEVTVWGPAMPEPLENFDIGVFANIRSMRFAAGWCEKVIVISHGVINDEKPHDLYKTAYTSLEVREYWRADGPILAQPIDLEFWREGGKRKPVFVFYSYRAPDVFGLDVVAKNLGLEFVWLKNVEAQEARVCLQSAALVAASGRAALEAMACGAPTIICDWRPYNGDPLICLDMKVAARNNYSGRGGKNPANINIEQFARETMAFQNPREHVVNNHDASKITQELLSLC